MSNEEYINEQVEAFRDALVESLNIAKDPEAVKWTIFSTGSVKVEEAVLDKLVDAFLPNIKGVFVYRVHELEEVAKLLKSTLSEIEKRLVTASIAKSDDFIVKFGVDNE